MARVRRPRGRQRALRLPAAGLRTAGPGGGVRGPAVCVSRRPRGCAPLPSPPPSRGGPLAARRLSPQPAPHELRGLRGALRSPGFAAAAPRLPFVRRRRPQGQRCSGREGSAPASRRRPPCASPAAPALGAGGGLGGACATVGTALTSRPQVRGRPLLSTCATSAGFSWQVCRPPLRTSSAGQWSPDLSLNRKLELEEEEEEGACRNRSGMRVH